MAGMMVCAVVMCMTEDHKSKLLIRRFIPKHIAGVNDSGVRQSMLCLKSLKVPPLIHTGLQPGVNVKEEMRNRFNGLLFLSRH
jgi:hypothetical protein